MMGTFCCAEACCANTVGPASNNDKPISQCFMKSSQELLFAKSFYFARLSYFGSCDEYQPIVQGKSSFPKQVPVFILDLSLHVPRHIRSSSGA
jgi:hypothetical protein